MSSDPHQPPPQYPPAYYPPPAGYYPPPAYVPVPFPDVTQGPETPPTAPARRSSAVPLLLGVIAVLLLAIAGVGGFFVWRALNAKPYMSDDDVALMEKMLYANNRASSCGDQSLFWLEKEGLYAVDLIDDLKRQGDRYRKIANDSELALVKSAGENHPFLGDVRPRRSEKMLILQEATKILLVNWLPAYRQFYLNDCVARRAAIRVEIPLNRPPYPSADAVGFERERQEAKYQGELRVAEAERELAIERQLEKERPAILSRRIAEAAKKIESELAKLEEDSRTP